MNTFISSAIIIARTDYGDADRIYTFLTPDHGKVQGIAKGVKKPKSRLAGGLQLFSICQIKFLAGRGEIDTVMSTQLVKQFSNITKNLDASSAGFEMLKIMTKLTHEASDPAHFTLLEAGLKSLNEHPAEYQLSRIWFLMHFLRLGGHAPNFDKDTAGNVLAEGRKYFFDADAMQFVLAQDMQNGLNSNHIKLLRLAGSLKSADSLYKIENTNKLLDGVEEVLKQSYMSVHRFQLL